MVPDSAMRNHFAVVPLTGNGSDVENVKDLAMGWGISMGFWASVLHTVNWHSIDRNY